MQNLNLLIQDTARLIGVVAIVLLAFVAPFQILGFTVLSGAEVSTPAGYGQGDALVVVPLSAAPRAGTVAVWSENGTLKAGYALTTSENKRETLVSSNMLLGSAKWIPSSALLGTITFTVPFMGWLVAGGLLQEAAYLAAALVLIFGAQVVELVARAISPSGKAVPKAHGTEAAALQAAGNAS